MEHGFLIQNKLYVFTTTRKVCYNLKRSLSKRLLFQENAFSIKLETFGHQKLIRCAVLWNWTCTNSKRAKIQGALFEDMVYGLLPACFIIYSIYIHNFACFIYFFIVCFCLSVSARFCFASVSGFFRTDLSTSKNHNNNILVKPHPTIKTPSWSQAQLKEAISCILTQQMRFTQASAKFKIPKGTVLYNKKKVQFWDTAGQKI